MIYLMFAAIFVTVKSMQKEINDPDGFSLADVFKNQQFFSMIVSLMATYVLWFVAAILFFDPWHMFTSVCGSPKPDVGEAFCPNNVTVHPIHSPHPYLY